MRRSVAIVAWVTTLLMGVTMFWTLTAGGFLAAMAEGDAAVDESVLLLSYVAIGSIVAVTMASATVGVLLAARTGGGRVPAVVAGLADLLAGVSIIAVSVLGVTATLVRYRRGSVVERQQLRWFVGAVLLAVIPIAISPQPGIGGPIWILLASVGLLLVPVSVGIAITRYRLYEIDRLISRGLAWVVLSADLLIVYAGGILVLQDVLGGVTQGDTVAVAASTLLAAALFQPLRRRIQRAMDHRFDRSRYDGERTAAGFGGRLRNEIDLTGLEADITATIATALRPSSMGIWLPGTTADRPG